MLQMTAVERGCIYEAHCLKQPGDGVVGMRTENDENSNAHLPCFQIGMKALHCEENKKSLHKLPDHRFLLSDGREEIRAIELTGKQGNTGYILDGGHHDEQDPEHAPCSKEGRVCLLSPASHRALSLAHMVL